MDTQKASKHWRRPGVDSPTAKAHVKVLKEALENYPTIEHLERMFAEFRLDVHKELSAFRQELAGFKIQVIWLLVASLAGSVVSLIGIVTNLVLTFWKH
jgi:hypothetical protein